MKLNAIGTTGLIAALMGFCLNAPARANDLGNLLQSFTGYRGAGYASGNQSLILSNLNNTEAQIGTRISAPG
jgi:hypothetical protein